MLHNADSHSRFRPFIVLAHTVDVAATMGRRPCPRVETLADNTAMIKAAQAAGFVLDGTPRQRTGQRTRGWGDVIDSPRTGAPKDAASFSAWSPE